MGNNSTTETKGSKMRNEVTVIMQDFYTGDIVERTIDSSNALTPNKCQRKNLERWMIERAEKQHETMFALIGWEFSE